MQRSPGYYVRANVVIRQRPERVSATIAHLLIGPRRDGFATFEDK